MATPDRSTLPGRRAVLLAGLAVGLAGCTQEDQRAGTATRGATASSPSAPVIQPGRPGESNQTLTGTSAEPTAPSQPAAADVTFMQDMIVHHNQALTMVELALPKAKTPAVVGIAKRIKAEQKPEIAYMAKWLTRFGKEVPREATNPRWRSHDHHGMPGMATDEQLRRLQQASGTEAEKQFLTLMIRHHEGALVMVRTRAKSGTDADAELFASDLGAVQSVQIRQMRTMLRDLG